MMLDLQNAAVIMIDMQGGFIDADSSLCVAGAEASIPACARVLEAARAAGVLVYHVRREYAADGSDVERVRKRIWLAGGKPLCAEGEHPESIEPPAELVAFPGEEVITKPRFSAFFATDLHERLQKASIDTIILIGTTTPNCIRSTCYDALSYDYDVIIIEDATSSRTPEVQRANIADMAYLGAPVMSSFDLAVALEGRQA